MQAIDILLEEHVVILQHLETLGRAAEKIARGEGPPKAFFEEALEICRDFADRYHHYKEEHVMFGLLAQKHVGRIDGEVDRHRDQHEACRNLIQQIGESLEGYQQELDSSARTVFRGLSDYVRILRSHIRSENEIFFPMAAEALTEAEGEALLEEFQRYEAKVGDVDLDAYRSRVEALAAQV